MNSRKAMHLFFKKAALLKTSLRSIFFILILLWCIGFSFNAIFPGSTFGIVTFPILKRIYGTVCHQRIEKTFFLDGSRLLVCARCTGIYTGALIFSLLSIFFFKRLSFGIKLLYAAMLPIFLDVVFTTLGIYPYTKIIAFITGLFFGSVVFLYILAAIENNFVDQKTNQYGS